MANGVGERALSKASWHILPLLGFGYLFSYLDRISDPGLFFALRSGDVGSWSGRRESNPRRKLGKLLLCH